MEVLVLTKSAKNGGYCVAGIDVETGDFVRLVSREASTNYAIPQRCMLNVNPLDLIDVSVTRRVPSLCQKENVEVRVDRWEKKKTFSKSFLQSIVSNKESFIFGDDSFFLEESVAQKFPYSLMVVRVTDLTVKCNDYKKTKASFYYNRVFYSNMSVTDPDYYNVDKHFDNAILVISIPNKGATSEYYSGIRCYKFVSKIFQ